MPVPAVKISTEAIDQGLDRKNLLILKQRFQQINAERLARTRSALSERQQKFLELLPLLLHCNHPMMPGYVSHQTPNGISGYSPTKAELRAAQGISRSFKYQRDPHKHRFIYSLFLMGSVGTVAHSESSDLDIWLCHKPGLSAGHVKQLELKCQQLSNWAIEMGLEAHFFLMDCDRFLRGEASSLDSEASGSAQHYLLLDEFYRTGLLLAGRSPLWWLIPSGREADYASYADTLLGKRFIRGADVLDFGSVATIPDGEFIGAGIWQLYKAIESPYKSVLKLLLLECYASEHPKTSPLSLQFKQLIYNGCLDVNELDPYVMIYRRLESYLQQRNEPSRLELLRRCFYFKVNKPLSKSFRGRKKSWQRQLLENLVGEWGWTPEHIAILDSRHRWKAARIIPERKSLVNELTNSYRFLMDFARQTQASVAINTKELNILGRKLHAALERRSGKVDWINLGISQDLSEPELTLCYQQPDNFQSTVWATHTQSAREVRTSPSQPIKKTRHLLENLLWCYANGILTGETRVEVITDKGGEDIATGEFTPAQVRQLIQALHQWLPLPLATVAHEQFQARAQARRLLLLINVGVNPHEHLQKQGIHRLSNQTDALGYSALKENLVTSVDVVTLNSWNEVTTVRHHGDALLGSLYQYLQLTPPGGPMPLPQLSFRCFTPSLGNAVGQRVEELFRDIAACYYSGTRPPSSRYIFEMATQLFVVQFVDGQPQISRCSNQQRLLEHLGLPQACYSPIMIDRYALAGHPLRAISGAAVDSAIQVYYQPRGKQADVYLVDEKGSLFNTVMPFYNQQSLLRPLHRFIRSVIDRQSLGTELYRGAFGVQPVDFFELKLRRGGALSNNEHHLERRTVTTDLGNLFFFNIQAIAEAKNDGEMRFNIYCNQQEFTEIEFGGDLFTAVARYILSHRQSAVRYPCYITDLDLSQCRDVLATQSGLQISHYLKIKAQLEARLNDALLSL